MPFRVEDLLAKFQNQIFSAISKAGDVKVLESRLVVLVVVTEDYFATAFLDNIILQLRFIDPLGQWRSRPSQVGNPGWRLTRRA